VPKISTSFPNHTRFYPGDNVSIQVEFFGLPIPEFNWIKNYIPIVNNTNGISFTVTVNSSILSIFDLSGQSGGQYTANASNNAGSTIKEFVIECKYDFHDYFTGFFLKFNINLTLQIG